MFRPWFSLVTLDFAKLDAKAFCYHNVYQPRKHQLAGSFHNPAEYKFPSAIANERTGQVSDQWVSSAIRKQLVEGAIVHIVKCAIGGSFQLGSTVESDLENSTYGKHVARMV
jgi:hypothetical protein